VQARDDLAHDFEALAGNIGRLTRQPGDIAGRAREARNYASADRVARGREHDGNRRCRLLCCEWSRGIVGGALLALVRIGNTWDGLDRELSKAPIRQLVLRHIVLQTLITNGGRVVLLVRFTMPRTTSPRRSKCDRFSVSRAASFGSDLTGFCGMRDPVRLLASWISCTRRDLLRGDVLVCHARWG
jgi:hypothetical protein